MNQTTPKSTEELALTAKPDMENESTQAPVQREVAMFGAGCFWGVEATFQRLPGVLATAVGYSGGHVENPTYKQVCTDRTGHAEVVRIEYDPTKIPYEHLLNVFWRSHDPTQLNRQGPDVGKQYRSVIFYFSKEQKAAAEVSKERVAKLNTHRNKTIVTQIEPAQTFWQAEEYHQKYLQKRGLENCHL
ncbi:MAG: peptide-methionine (S)-S-oxide reductase MsrA [Sedimentisphaerales bacterium]|nr:peptide-methionine (S)-S-oxide reductase MsrA [Sedimentisphaerales bacterium]